MITVYREYARFWQRSTAMLLDLLIISAWSILLFYCCAGEAGYSGFEDTAFVIALLIYGLLITLWILLFCFLYAATPGKLLLDCEIIDAETGQRATFKQCLLRYIGYFVAVLPLGLGILWMLKDKRHQGWHDKIANTVVIIHEEAAVSLYELERER